jgi:hypothetical protein
MAEEIGGTATPRRAQNAGATLSTCDRGRRACPARRARVRPVVERQRRHELRLRIFFSTHLKQDVPECRVDVRLAERLRLDACNLGNAIAERNPLAEEHVATDIPAEAFLQIRPSDAEHRARGLVQWLPLAERRCERRGVLRESPVLAENQVVQERAHDSA